MQHQMPHTQPAGVVSLMLTPFNEDGGIDWPAYQRYTTWQVRHKPSALFAVCGSSEMKWLTRDERLRLVRETITYADGVPVIATGNLDPDLQKHAQECQQLADLGVSGVVLVPPPQVCGDHDRYYDYIATIRDQVSCPVFVYEWPQTPNHLMDASLFKALAENGVIAGIKDTTCTLEGIRGKQQVAQDVVVYQANTPYLLEALKMGVRGIMAITSTAKADLLVALWQAHLAGTEDVVPLHRELVYLDALLRQAYPAAAKYLARLQEVEMPLYTRWPVELAPEIRQAIDVWYHNLPEIYRFDSRTG